MTTTNQRAVEVLAEMRDLGTPPCCFAHDQEELDALNLAITTLRTTGWRPISEAPRDGSWVLLSGGSIDYGWDGNEPPSVVSGQFTDELNGGKTDGHWQFAWYDGGYYGEYKNPTHFMPLPPPPGEG